MTNPNDIVAVAKEWLDKCERTSTEFDDYKYAINDFASYLSAKYTLTPKEEVKECDHTASCVHCWDKQYPSNKSTGVKIEPLDWEISDLMGPMTTQQMINRNLVKIGKLLEAHINK